MKDAYGNDLKVGDRVVAGALTVAVTYAVVQDIAGYVVKVMSVGNRVIRHFYPEEVVKVGESHAVWMFPEYKFNGSSDHAVD